MRFISPDSLSVGSFIGGLLEQIEQRTWNIIAMAQHLYAKTLLPFLLSAALGTPHVSSSSLTLIPTPSQPQPTAPAFPVVISSPEGVYNSSKTPSHFPWNTYNYCNAPHVNAEHYVEPPHDAELVHLNMVMRHHKRPSDSTQRTPDNLYPNENSVNQIPWDCTDFQEFAFGGPGSANVFHITSSPPWHPFLSQIWNGTCDEGQLTRGGLEDSKVHGKDFWDVYSKKLGFLREVNTDDIFIRTSTETRTFEVASGMLVGMDPGMLGKSFPVHTQPSPIDNIPPSYSCPVANNIRNQYQSVPAWTDHLASNMTLKNRLDQTLGTAGLSAWATWYDHFFDTFTSRTCNGHPLPCNSTGGCVSEADAAKVFAIGDWEYNYIWNAAQNSDTYTQLTFGVYFQELALNLRAFQSGTSSTKLLLTVGHDGSMIRLASGLGLGKQPDGAPLRWPALGSEIIIEVWKLKNHAANSNPHAHARRSQPSSESSFNVRVMHEGTPVPSLEWMPLESFIQLVEAQIPGDVFKACNGL